MGVESSKKEKKTLFFDSKSSLILIFEDDEYIAFRNVLHFSLNLIFNSFCKFCIKDSFLIRRDLMNFYAWSFSFVLFKKVGSELNFSWFYCIMIKNFAFALDLTQLNDQIANLKAHVKVISFSLHRSKLI